jgi:hypothetical protein
MQKGPMVSPLQNINTHVFTRCRAAEKPRVAFVSRPLRPL